MALKLDTAKSWGLDRAEESAKYPDPARIFLA